MDQRNFFYRGFNAVYARVENFYRGVIGAMVHHSLAMVAIALVLAGLGVWGVARLPTAFIPNEDQGFALVGVQLPDGAALGRTSEALALVTRIAIDTPGVETAIAISGISVLDNSASLANAGLTYVILKDWKLRGAAQGQDLRTILQHIQAELANLPDGYGFVLVPPPIQGIGNAGGFQMQLQQRDGSFDFAKMQRTTQAVLEAASTQSGLGRTISSFRAEVPQLRVNVDRVKAESLHVSVGDVFATLSSYLGSTYVNQFNKFGLTLQVYVQADSPYRTHPQDLLKLTVRNTDGNPIPIGALATIEDKVGPSLISLYNLYLTAAVVGTPAPGFSSGDAIGLMEQIADRTLPPGSGFEWTGMSFQEVTAGNQILYAFGLAILLVYLCLAGQYESWVAPLSVILAVPLALIGPAVALSAVGLANNLYTQIGLMLLIALGAKNAILIVEVARDLRLKEGHSIIEAAVGAAVLRFRPILMTSFAFILGVVPLVTATGAGAAARVSLGMCVMSGMIASTCLAVLFVPSFFAVLQRLEEGKPKPVAAAAE
jgi:HAE1 family hydrophobic/amphiphilic exporter-1